MHRALSIFLPIHTALRRSLFPSPCKGEGQGGGFFFFFFLFFPATLTASPTYIPARDYAAVAEQKIDAATTSVHLYMYLFNARSSQPDDAPARLLAALLRAQKRGLEVRVVLDGAQDVYEDVRQNEETAQTLADAGISVAVTQGVLLHAKALVVDGRITLIGSTNWTTTALDKNVEANVLIDDKAAAQALEKDLSAAPTRPVPPASQEGPFIPRDFLFSPTGLGAMATADDPRALDAYLFLMRTIPLPPHPGGPAEQMLFTINAKLLAQAVRLQGPAENDDRRQIAKILKRLKNNYHLIDYDIPFDKDPSVRLLPAQGQDGIVLPDAYFTHQWDTRLTLAAKTMLLLGLHYAKQSKISPRWSVSVETLARTHHVSPWFIMQGTTELRRQNLLEVEHAPYQEGVQRPLNVYLMNRIYDPTPVEEKLKELRKTYGEDLFQKARSLAALVYEDMDVEGVEELLRIGKKNGVKVLDEVESILGPKSPDNPKRCMAYLLGTLRGIISRSEE